MRKLSDSFVDCLQSGFLSGVSQIVRYDPDLNLEIREGYLNIYFKGNFLLKLTEASSTRYKVEIHRAFAAGLNLPSELTDVKTTAEFMRCIPQLKQNIVQHGKSSLEIEYEQMIIRANNFEPRNNSEYFIVDRQYAVSVKNSSAQKSGSGFMLAGSEICTQSGHQGSSPAIGPLL